MAAITFQLGQKRYALKMNISFLLVCAVIFALFCYLGEWQIHRYHFKQTLLQAYEQNKQSAPVPFAELQKQHEIAPFQRVTVTGDYVNDMTILLQNRPYKDQPGFEVITPLRIDGEEKLLLIDRGWVAGTQTPPPIDSIAATQNISGEIKLLNERQFILGKNILDANATPMLMQKIDIQELKKTTQEDFYPYLLRLDAAAPNGYVRDWTISTVQPERHLGYAVQWFAMAVTLLIASFCFCCKKVTSSDDANAI